MKLDIRYFSLDKLKSTLSVCKYNIGAFAGDMPGAYELAKVIYRKEPSENNGAVLI
jgi:hypothetical protein